MRPIVAIIGGGITGLAAAHRVLERNRDVEVRLLEAGHRLGGVLHTQQYGGYLIEEAADNFLTTPTTAVDLCRRCDFDHELLYPASCSRRALIFSRGKLHPLPRGFQVMAPSRISTMLISSLLSWRGKLRLALEIFSRPRLSSEDESVANFACRHFGRETLERLIQPLLGGIYTADVERLSMAAALPRFVQMERDKGSLIRALLAQRRTKPDPSAGRSGGAHFAAPRHGMSSLVARLADRLPPGTVTLNAPVESVELREGRWWQLSVGGDHPQRIHADAVLMATPAYQSAKLLQSLDPAMAKQLAEIEYAGCAIVSIGFERAQIAHPLDGGGFVVPLVEQRQILSCSFSSQKYSGRAPDGAVLLRVFIGGACQGELLALSDDELMALAEREIRELLGIRGEPTMRRLIRHRNAMPQYHVGHAQRVALLETRAASFPCLSLAGSAFHGVGMPACIQSGHAAADRLIEQLQKSPATRIPFPHALPA